MLSATIFNKKCYEMLVDYSLSLRYIYKYKEMINMIDMNIRVLRKKNKLSQEQLAEKVSVSRQTVAKCESGEALPDIYKCKTLSEIFQVTLDQMSIHMSDEEAKHLAPKGKHFLGVVKVGERGQIVIRKQAREMYHIQPGDRLVVLGEDATEGIAILKRDGFLERADMISKAEPEDDLECAKHIKLELLGISGL